MGWKDLLSKGEQQVLPWVGGRELIDAGVLGKPKRIYRLSRLPQEYGWYNFELSGRKASPLKKDTCVWDRFYLGGDKVVRGYVVGDRLVPDDARVETVPERLIEQTQPIALVEGGLDRFAKGYGAILQDDLPLVYVGMLFPEGPELEVEVAYQDRLPSVDHIPGVSPALDLAFRWLTWVRDEQEEHERKLEEGRAKEEARQQVLKDMGTGLGRRNLAQRDFNAAARAALSLSGSELLDVREGRGEHEKIVQYRFRHRRLECVVHAETLRVIDSGVCLNRHGEKGDTYFTLESLPGVIGQALDMRRLVVYRHAPGDEPGWDGDNEEGEDW